MDQVDARQRRPRQPGEKLGGVASEQADVAEIVGFDLREDLGHAVDIRLAADEARAAKVGRFRRKMLAAAEADFEPHLVDGGIEDLARLAWRGDRNIEREMRQEMFDQVRLMLTELVSLATAEEGALALGGVAGIGVVVTHRSV
jgi:hypothetical protein